MTPLPWAASMDTVRKRGEARRAVEESHNRRCHIVEPKWPVVFIE